MFDISVTIYFKLKILTGTILKSLIFFPKIQNVSRLPTLLFNINSLHIIFTFIDIKYQRIKIL